MILDGMLSRLFLRSTLMVLGVLVSVTSLSNFLESAKRLFTGPTSAFQILWYYVCLIPSFAYLLIPVSLVVGACIAFALLGRRRELLAIMAAGVGPKRMLMPVLAVALGFAASMFLLSEFIVPQSYLQVEALIQQGIGRIDDSWRFLPRQNWYPSGENRLIRVWNVLDDGKRLDRVIVFELDDDFHVSERTDIRWATWEQGRWKGTQVERRGFSGGQQVVFQRSQEQILPWRENPEHFRSLTGRPQEKTLAQLDEAIIGLEQRGLNAVEYRLAWHTRFSIPLLGIVLLFAAFPWLTQPQRNRTLAGALIEAAGLVFGTYLVVVLSNAAVSGGNLSPWLGAWLPVVVPLLVGLVFWLVSRGP